MWSQTPQFDLFLKSKDDVGIEMNVHHGIIKSLDFDDARFPIVVQEKLRAILLGQKLHEIRGWTSFLQHHLQTWDSRDKALAARLDEIFPSLISEL